MSTGDAEAANESTPLLRNEEDEVPATVEDEVQRAHSGVNRIQRYALRFYRTKVEGKVFQANYVWCIAFPGLIAIILMVTLIITRRLVPSHTYANTPALGSAAKATQGLPRALPHPPRPYEYNDFMSWFDQQNFKGYNLKLIPKRSWFDSDAAVKRRKDWFQNEDMTAVQKAYKAVDRWPFMISILRTGHEEIQSSTTFHLKVMRWFEDHLKKAETVLDMGSGTGILLRYLQVFAQQLGNERLRAVGLDVDANVIELAKRLVNAESQRAPGLAEPYMFAADMYKEDGVKARLKKPEDKSDPIAKLDLVIIGAALGNIEMTRANESRDDRAKHIALQAPLSGIWPMISVNGLVVVPICKENSKVDTSCNADLFLVTKDKSHEPQILHGGNHDTEFETVFKVATNWAAVTSS